MQDRLWKIASLLLVLSIVIAGYYYVDAHRSEVSQLQIVSPWFIALVVICFVATVFLRGIFTLAVLRAVHVNLSILESFALSMVGTMAYNLLPTMSGSGIRGAYLKRVHNLPIAHFGSTMAAYTLFNIFVGTLIGLLALLLITIAGAAPRLDLIAILLTLCLSSAAFIFIVPSISLSYKGRIANFARRIGEGWNAIRESRSVVIVALFSSLGAPLFGALGFYAGFQVFGTDISLPGALLITSSYAIGGLVSLTPGGLGFQEALGVYFGSILQLDPLELLLILVAVRVVRIGTSIVVGIPCLWRLHTSASQGTPAS